GAEPILALALRLRQETYTERHPATARARFALGRLQVERGAHAQGEALLSSASATFEELLGPRDPEYIATLEELTSAYLKRGKYREARTAIDRALRIGHSGPIDTMARRINLLAQVKIAVGECGEARRELEKLLRA